MINLFELFLIFLSGYLMSIALMFTEKENSNLKKKIKLYEEKIFISNTYNKDFLEAMSLLDKEFPG